MARKSLTADAGTPQGAANGVTDETVVVKGDGVVSDSPATAAVAGDEQVAGGADAPSQPTVQEPAGVVSETVVVSDNGVTTGEPSPATPEPLPPPPAQNDLETGRPGAVVVVTCSVAGGRRRAGRRWEAGETRVPAGELSDDDLAALRADILLRVAIEAA